MVDEINNPTHNEMVFRNFIRSHQLTAKWHEFIKENPFGIKTEKSRATFARWLLNDYTKTYDKFELPILARFLTQDKIPQQAKRELLFYTTCQADKLAGLLTTNILYPAFQNGLSNIDRNELIQFVNCFPINR